MEVIGKIFRIDQRTEKSYSKFLFIFSLFLLFCITSIGIAQAEPLQVTVTASPSTLSSGGGSAQIMVKVMYRSSPLQGAKVTLQTDSELADVSYSSDVTDSMGVFPTSMLSTTLTSGSIRVTAFAQKSTIDMAYGGSGYVDVPVQPVVMIPLEPVVLVSTTTPIPQPQPYQPPQSQPYQPPPAPPYQPPPPQSGVNQPVAVISVDQYAGKAPLTVNFDARQSYAPDGSISQYAWDFGDGTTGSGYISFHAYQNKGIYQVNLTVTDNAGLTSAPAGIEIRVNSLSTCVRDYNEEGILTADGDGTLNCTIYVHSRDGSALLTFPRSIRVSGMAYASVPSLRIESIRYSETPPFSLGEGYTFRNHAYRLTPDGVTFNPPGMLTIILPDPEWRDISSQTPVIMWYNPQNSQWELLTTTLNPTTHSLSTPLSHFSVFALFIRQQSPVISPVQEPRSDSGFIDRIHQATGPRNKGLPLSFILPDWLAPVAAICTGCLVPILGATISASGVFSRRSNKIFDFIKNYLGSETTGLMSMTEIEKWGILPSVYRDSAVLGLSFYEWGVICISALGFAIAFILKDRFELKVITIIIFVCVAGIGTILHDLAHKVMARQCGCTTEYQFWGLGAVTMFLTAWIFGTIFAKPSRTVIQSKTAQTAEESARIMIAGPVVSLTVAILSLFLIPFGGIFLLAGSMGFSLNMLLCVYALLPIIPMDGKKIYDWNKWIWSAIFIPIFIVYVVLFMI